jgi:hypothetical protein
MQNQSIGKGNAFMYSDGVKGDDGVLKAISGA